MFLMLSYWNSLLGTVIDHLYGSLWSKILYFSAGNAAAEPWMLGLLKKLLHQMIIMQDSSLDGHAGLSMDVAHSN